MSTWEGFTDEDLKRVKHQNDRTDGAAVSRGGGRGRPGFRKKTQRPVQKIQTENQKEQFDLPPEQRLSAPKKKPDVGNNEVKKCEKPENREIKEKSVSTGPGEVKANQNAGGEPKEESQNDGWESTLKEEVEDLMDEEEIVNLEMSNLDKFREQQKMIEELNKKKKQLLASAIQKRQKLAKAEAMKLMQIQKELEKLDQLLTVDVSIIRDRIEEATRQYSDAQKRYDRAEKEFITAKMHLFETQEQKEHLTEHLYTVIHQNEVRKAKKLKELMEKLEMENSEDVELSELVSHMELPSLTVLNSMQTKTIHGPKSPPANARISLKTSTSTEQSEEAESPKIAATEGQVKGQMEENEGQSKQEATGVQGNVSNDTVKTETSCDSSAAADSKNRDSKTTNNISEDACKVSSTAGADRTSEKESVGSHKGTSDSTSST